LAHLDEFEDAGERTLLIVDEAHELENAATAALAHEVDTLAVRQAAAAARGYIADQPADPSRVRGAAEDLEQWWEDGDLGSAALLAFSTQPAEALGRVTLRTVTVESPFQGLRQVGNRVVWASELSQFDPTRTGAPLPAASANAWRGFAANAARTTG
jgi:Rad3-related DNA helicase